VKLDSQRKGVSTMSEFQRIAELTPGPKPTPAAAALRGVKFALAALLAGSRSIPLGDNGRVTRELGEYGAHLRGC
jgi:hypothetical protein